MIGITFYNFKEECWNLIQLFADNKDSEKDVLLELIKYVQAFDLIITYNGDSFDIPFINSRLSLYNIAFDLFTIENFDIYKLIKKNRIFLEFENYKLKTIERNLEIFRNDIYSGGDCIQFYKDYLITKDKVLLERILQHNYEDLFYLVDIIKIIDIIDASKSIKISKGEVMINSITFLGDVFKVEGDLYSNEDLKLLHYDNLYNISIKDNGFILEFACDIGLVSPEEKGLFIDKNKFALNDITTINANYKVPDRFILLQVEKKLFLDNIKNIVSSIINKSIKNLM